MARKRGTAPQGPPQEGARPRQGLSRPRPPRYRIAIEKVEKGLRYAYRDRRNKKRDFRGLWIQRINAGAREHGLTYSQFMNGMKLAGIELDRKVMADLAIREPEAFAVIAKQAQAALGQAPPLRRTDCHPGRGAARSGAPQSRDPVVAHRFPGSGSAPLRPG